MYVLTIVLEQLIANSTRHLYWHPQVWRREEAIANIQPQAHGITQQRYE